MVERWVDFGQKWMQVFAVEYLGCGGSEGGMSGGLERWCFGEFCGGVGGDSVVCGVGNLEVDEDGFCEWRFRRLGLILGRGRTVRC